MSEEVRSRAFEPLYTTEDSGKGTGPGLSMGPRPGPQKILRLPSTPLSPYLIKIFGEPAGFEPGTY